MTLDEAMQTLLDNAENGMVDVEEIKLCFAEMEYETLQQEPCKDCVSRQAVRMAIFDECDVRKLDIDFAKVLLLQRAIKALPPVTPQPKTGHWIQKYAEDGCGEKYSYWACSECGRDVGFNLANIEDVLSDYPYCHCGAKMESEGICQD